MNLKEHSDNLWKYGVDTLKVGIGGMLFYSIAAVGLNSPERSVDIDFLPILCLFIVLLGVLLCLIGGIGKNIYKVNILDKGKVDEYIRSGLKYMVLWNIFLFVHIIIFGLYFMWYYRLWYFRMNLDFYIMFSIINSWIILTLFWRYLKIFNPKYDHKRVLRKVIQKTKRIPFPIIIAIIGFIGMIVSAIIMSPPSPKPDFILYPYSWQAPENISMPSNITVIGKETKMILGIQNVGQASGLYHLEIFVENLSVEEYNFHGTTGKPIIYNNVKIAPSSTHEYYFYFKPVENNIEDMPSKASIGIEFMYYEERLWGGKVPHTFYAIRNYTFDNNLKYYTKTGEDVIGDVIFT